MRDLVDELLQAKVKSTLFGGDHAPRLGRLVLEDRLGAGAMGTVFAARDPKLERKVAVKVLHAAHTGGVLAEARALARLQHPNVVALYDAFEGDDGLVYLTMELAPGVSMRAWQPHGWRDVVRAMREAGAGIAAAHAAGLVHRDIKPDHVLVGEDRARVVDFGLARAGDETARAGTPGYIAPEVEAGGPATALSDQYAFGVTLREMLAGTAPPAWLGAVIVRATATDPRARFANMNQVVAALGRDRRRTAMLGIAATALVCGAGFGALAFRSGAGDPCAAGDSRQAAAWSSEARAGVARGLGDAPWSQQTLASLDDVATRWRASYRRVCEASHVRHEQSDTLLDLRMSCLDRASARFTDLVAQLATADRATRVAAPAAVGELPDATACETWSDPGELALPTDPAERRLALAGNRAIDSAWALFALGRYREARAELAKAEPARAPGVHAAALALSAAIEARIGDAATARERLDEALIAAARARAPAIEADVWLRRMRYELFAGDPDKVIEWRTFATAAFARTGRSTAELDGVVAEALRDRGALGPARDLLERALAAPGVLRPEQRALLELNLGSIEIAAGHSVRAVPILQRARDRVRGALGDHHPELALYDDKLAAAARGREHLAEAYALHEESVQLRTAAFGPDDRSVATSWYQRGLTDLAIGEPLDARLHLSRALDMRMKVYGERSPRLGEVYAALGDVALVERDLPAAREQFAHAAVDPRVALAARRFAAGETVELAEIPPYDRGELLSIDRAAALAVRAELLQRAGKLDELHALADSLRPLVTPDVDRALTAPIERVLALAASR